MRSPRLFFTVLFVGVLLASALGVLLEEAGKDVQLGVAIAAIAALVLSWAWVCFTLFGAARGARRGDREVLERARRRITRVHLPVMAAFPFLLIAAHPWGIATVAVGAGTWIFCHFMFLHVQLAIGLIARRRDRRDRRAAAS